MKRALLFVAGVFISLVSNAQETLQSVTDRGNTTVNKISAAYYSLFNSEYNKPSAYLINGDDTNWSYGASSDNNLHYWMQVTFHGANVNTRGFRIYDKSLDAAQRGNSYPFVINGLGDVGIGTTAPFRKALRKRQDPG